MTVAAILVALTAASIPPPLLTLDIVRNMPQRIASLASGNAPGGARIVVLGDSTVVSYDDGRTVVDRLDQTLQTAVDRPVRIHSLASLGMSALEYYPIAQRIADTRPDAVVLAFNLQWLSPRWRDFLARPEMLALLRPSWLPKAVGEPLYWWKITFDRLLLYVTLWQVGAVNYWHAYRVEQVRVGNGLDALRGGIQRRWQNVPEDTRITGMPAAPLSISADRPDRLIAAVLRDLYGPALDGADADHPALKLLAAILAAFAHDDVPVVMYLVPANVEYMRKVGIFDDRGLTQTIETLRTICDANGAVFMDLHALLPDAGFRDGGGHFIANDQQDGPLLVAQKVTPALRELLSRARTPAHAVQ